MTLIRIATVHDREDIRAIHLSAFPETERQLVSTLALKLLDESQQTISLVAESDGAVVGHIAFSPVTMKGNEHCQGYILAPLAVRPEYQDRGIGSKLIKSGLHRLAEQQVNILFVYGDPGYYGKFGFDAETAQGFLPPYRLQYPFGWLAMTLNEGVDTESTVEISCAAPLNDPALW